MNTVDSLKVWTERAYAVCCTPTQREAIAILCRDAQERGDTLNSVWHQSARYFGTKCNCVPCRS